MMRPMNVSSGSLAHVSRARIHVVALGAALGLAVSNPCVASAQAQASLRQGTFAERGEDVPVEYGEFEVPANRTSGDDATLTLRFVRFDCAEAAAADRISRWRSR